MIRQYTKTLLLSARLLNKQFAMTPLNMFTTFKPAKPLNRPFLLNNNSFTFAELPKHKVLTVIDLITHLDASPLTHYDGRKNSKMECQGRRLNQ